MDMKQTTDKITPLCLDQRAFWMVSGSLSLLHLSLLKMSGLGHILSGVLVKWVAFLASLHWPLAGADFGVGVVSCVEMLILYEVWAGERLVLDKAVARYRRPF